MWLGWLGESMPALERDMAMLLVGLPLTIGIDSLSSGYIGHYLTSVQPSWQNVGAT
jgi:hypothetical protein